MKDIIKNEINRQLKRLISLTVMGSLLTVSVFSVGAFSQKIEITDGENKISVVTMSTDLNKILEIADLNLNPDDLIFKVDNVDGNTQIVIKRAFDVTVSLDGQKKFLKFVSGTVSDAIKLAGIDLKESDSVTPDLHTELEPNMEIKIQERVKIKVNADGRIKDYAVPKEITVSDALNIYEIPLYENDIVNKDLNDTVYEGMEISIERIGYRNKIVSKEVPYKTIKKSVNYLNEGETEVSVKGVNGESEIVIKETLKDGEVVKSEEIKNKVTVAPVNEIILVGAKKNHQIVQVSVPGSSKKSLTESGNGSLADHKGNVLSYSKVLTGSGTAYTANAGAKTSTGSIAKYGTVAVNPNIIPYGTKMYIVSTDGFVYGYATASDTGGALRQGTALVDLYMNSTQECFSFGRRTVKVYILK